MGMFLEYQSNLNHENGTFEFSESFKDCMYAKDSIHLFIIPLKIYINYLFVLEEFTLINCSHL